MIHDNSIDHIAERRERREKEEEGINCIKFL